MIKTIVSFTLLLGLANVNVVSAQKTKQSNKTSSKTEVKFLEGIELNIAPSSVEQRSTLSDFETQYFAKKDDAANDQSAVSKLESASKVQIKYALLLDTEVEQIQNVNLYSAIEQWI